MTDKEKQEKRVKTNRTINRKKKQDKRKTKQNEDGKKQI